MFAAWVVEVKCLDKNPRKTANRRLKMAGTDFKLLKMSRKTAAPAPVAAPQKSKRQSRRDLVLAEAARAFNERGIAGTSVNDIAAKLELTRAALYYYIDDRDDLVFQTYLRSCELTADDLAAAHESERNGLARLLDYVSRALDAERAPAAVLSEISYLSGSAKSVVEKAHARNVQALERFVREGVADRSIRACDAELAAQAVVGLVSWAPLSPAWIGDDEDETRSFRKRAADAVTRLLRDGIASDPKAEVKCPINVDTFRPRPANMFDRRDAAALKMDQIAMTASRLFSQQGIDGTSLDQISEELGATKGALYHYFADKEALVMHCYRRGFALFEQFVETAERAGKSGLERGMIGVHLNTQAQAGDFFEIQIAGEPDLPHAYEVKADGTIRLPIVGALQVKGQDARQVREAIVKWFTDHKMSAQVDVTLRRPF